MHPLHAHLLIIAAIGLGALAAVVAIPAAILFVVFFFAAGPSIDEVARSTAPDGAVDAVLVETNGGATTSFGYDIYVVPRGAKWSGNPVATLYGARRSEHAYGANLHWDAPDTLTVRYLSAISRDLKQPRLTLGGSTIRVALRAGETDRSAAPGGMLRELRSRQ